MIGDPYTIRIFVPDGDPEGLRIIDRMNWTGLGIVFPREDWAKIKHRQDFSKPGVYILIGYVSEDDDLPTLYIGQGDVVRARLESQRAEQGLLEQSSCLCFKRREWRPKPCPCDVAGTCANTARNCREAKSQLKWY